MEGGNEQQQLQPQQDPGVGTAQGSSLCMRSPGLDVELIGFSKGAVVLNQVGCADVLTW